MYEAKPEDISVRVYRRGALGFLNTAILKKKLGKYHNIAKKSANAESNLRIIPRSLFCISY